MSLDFARIKAVPITDILVRYGIRLRFNGEWGSAQCPLPTHKPGDNDKAFQVNVAHNYWKCWSASCNDKAGVKGGDCINFVALKEGITQYAAAQKIAEWFHINEKTARPSAERSEKENPKRTVSNTTSPSASVKGYMSEVDAWFDELVTRGQGETDDAFWKRVRNGVKARLIDSYKNGQRVARSLPVQ